MLYSLEKLISRKILILPIKTFPSPVLSRNPTMLQYLILQFPLYYLLSGSLREVKNKRQFQTFSSKSGRGRLRELVAYKRFQI